MIPSINPHRILLSLVCILLLYQVDDVLIFYFFLSGGRLQPWLGTMLMYDFDTMLSSNCYSSSTRWQRRGEFAANASEKSVGTY